MLVLSAYIAKHEFAPLRRFLDLDDVREGAAKVLRGLGTRLKPPKQMAHFQYFKVRIGKRNGARMIVFVITDHNAAVPVLIRMKKDRKLGANMAMNNPAVVAQINKNLDHVLEDIEQKRYEKFSLG